MAAAAGFWAAVWLQCCIITAPCLSHAFRSPSSAVTVLLADDINFASHNASQNSDLIGHKMTCRSKFLPVKFITLPLSLGPVPR